MITLTTPAQVLNTLGGNTFSSYDKVVLSSLIFNPISKNISATVLVTSITAPDMTPINGSLSISAVTNVLEISVDQLDFHRRVVLSGAQVTAVTNMLTNTQNTVEAGLVSLGIVAGTQTTGI